jgi:integrase
MTGIIVRHSRSCKTKASGCKCGPSYRAWVYDRRSGQKVARTFRNLSEAKSWRADATTQLGKGTMSAPTKTTVREAGLALIEGMRSGAVRTKSGVLYKPSVIRGYEADLEDRINPELGAYRLSELTGREVQRFADALLAEGLSESRIRNVLMPLRVIYRRHRRDVPVNPTKELELPAVRGGRDRIASPEEAAKLIEAVGEPDRALWACAMYAGLRSGELQALTWENVDLPTGVIHVERSYDPKEHCYVETKNRQLRRVPIAGVLRDYLIAHKLRSGRSEGLCFPGSRSETFTPSNVRRRAHTAWSHAMLEPIALHECRHTFASLMIAAGVNAKALSSYMGHSSITVTLDRYGHLMPGNEDEAAALLDTYLEEKVRPSCGPVRPSLRPASADSSG